MCEQHGLDNTNKSWKKKKRKLLSERKSIKRYLKEKFLVYKRVWARMPLQKKSFCRRKILYRSTWSVLLAILWSYLLGENLAVWAVHEWMYDCLCSCLCDNKLQLTWGIHLFVRGIWVSMLLGWLTIVVFSIVYCVLLVCASNVSFAVL